MSNITVNVLSNAAIYLLPAGIPAAPIVAGGQGLGGLLGRAAEITIPQPKHKYADYKGLGMAGDLELWMGVDKLEASIKWSSFDPLVVQQIANPFTVYALQVMGSVMSYTSQGVSATLPVIFLLSGAFKDPGELSIKQHEQAEINSKVAVYHSECYLSGVQLYLWDVFSNTYIVNGNDVLEAYRDNMGG